MVNCGAAVGSYLSGSQSSYEEEYVSVIIFGVLCRVIRYCSGSVYSLSDVV